MQNTQNILLYKKIKKMLPFYTNQRKQDRLRNLTQNKYNQINHVVINTMGFKIIFNEINNIKNDTIPSQRK